MTDEVPLVKAADDMDVETFLKHMNARHTPLGKMTKIGRSNIPGDENENLLRIYHERTHKLGLDAIGGGRTREVNHTHKEPKK